MIDPPDVIGPRLRELRLALGIKTQSAFALAIGVEKNTYNPMEKGENPERPLTFDVACKIRQRFGIPIDYLFYGAIRSELPASVLMKIQSGLAD